MCCFSSSLSGKIVSGVGSVVSGGVETYGAMLAGCSAGMKGVTGRLGDGSGGVSIWRVGIRICPLDMIVSPRNSGSI